METRLIMQTIMLFADVSLPVLKNPDCLNMQRSVLYRFALLETLTSCLIFCVKLDTLISTVCLIELYQNRSCLIEVRRRRD